MGLRSLIEINHDSSQRLVDNPQQLVSDLLGYIRSSDRYYGDQLYSKYDMRVVALRHSSDVYYIPTKSFGFPAKLPWDDFEAVREEAVAKAKALTNGDRRSKRGLEEIITRLVGIIEHQQEILDAEP